MRSLGRILICLLLPLLVSGAEPPTPAYGENPVTGAYAELNGIKLYHEQYGTGEPAVLVIHGNGASLAQMEFQISHFARTHRVIAADSRGHGKSGLGAGRLTYVQQADDLNALLDQLHLRNVYVIGWSDGGTIGLLLTLRHPDKVAKLAVTGANLFPDCVSREVMAGTMKDDQQALAMIAQGDKSQDWELIHQRTNLMITQPDIRPSELGNIKIPVLVMAGDRDLILPEHTLLIYKNLARGQLAIFPHAEHSVCRDQPEIFNATVARFFAEP
jgi:pimeloyl-ACP methyl ester carboxylesterase